MRRDKQAFLVQYENEPSPRSEMIQGSASRERNRVLNERNWIIGARAVGRVWARSNTDLGYVTKHFNPGEARLRGNVFKRQHLPFGYEVQWHWD